MLLLKQMDESEVRMKNPLVLAYIGDTVYDLYIRTSLVESSQESVNEINKRACGVVNARAQAEVAELLLPSFTEEEAAIYRRGRNAKCGTIPKNMSVADYHKATALEAVIGYLFLTGQNSRIEELFAAASL